MYNKNNLSNINQLKKLKMMLQIKKEVKKVERKLKRSNSFFYINTAYFNKKSVSLNNNELAKKLEIKKSNYERLTRG